MLTDQQLTDELKLAFGRATREIEPGPGLAAVVHRRHRSARRRAVAVRVALPAVAACAGGLALVGGGGGAAPGPSARRAPSSAPVDAGSAARVQTAAYLLKVPARADARFDCMDQVGAAVTRDDVTWRAVGPDNCTLILVVVDTALPADAHPIELAGVPGLYGTTDGHSRTIYSRNKDSSWSALTVAADTPDSALRTFYVPAEGN